MLLTGKGVTIDLGEAERWLVKAAASDNHNGIANLAHVRLIGGNEKEAMRGYQRFLEMLPQGQGAVALQEDFTLLREIYPKAASSFDVAENKLFGE